MEEQNFVSLGGSKDVQPTIYLSTRNRKWIAISGIFSIFQLVIGIIFLVSFDFLNSQIISSIWIVVNVIYYITKPLIYIIFFMDLFSFSTGLLVGVLSIVSGIFYKIIELRLLSTWIVISYGINFLQVFGCVEFFDNYFIWKIYFGVWLNKINGKVSFIIFQPTIVLNWKQIIQLSSLCC
jgi:hypothetical protein